MEPIRKVLATNGFKIASKKRVILRPGSEKTVTGVRLGKFGPRAPHLKMSELRAAIFRLASHGVGYEDMPRYTNNLVGRIAYISSINKTDGQKLSGYAARLDVKLDRFGKAVLPSKSE
jgi:hypothetical protein